MGLGATGGSSAVARACAPLFPFTSGSVGTAGDARLWLARTHRPQQKFSQAEAVLTDAVKKAPKSPMRPDLLYDLATVVKTEVPAWFAEDGVALRDHLTEEGVARYLEDLAAEFRQKKDGTASAEL